MKLRIHIILINALLLLGTIRSSASFNKSISDSLFFVFNQPEYSSGDTAYFTGFAYPVSVKCIFSVKLFDTQHNVISQTRVLFNQGVGSSYLPLPADLRPGSYELVSCNESSREQPQFYRGYLNISKVGTHQKPDTLDRDFQESSLMTITTSVVSPERRTPVIVKLSNPRQSQNAVSITVYREDLFTENQRNSNSLVLTEKLIKTTLRSNSVNNFPAFFSGHVKLLNEDKFTALKLTFYFCDSDFTYSVQPNANGEFSFPLLRNFGNEIIYSRLTQQGRWIKDAQIVIDDILFPREKISDDEPLTISPYGRYAMQKQFIAKSFNYFSSKGRNSRSKMIDSGYEGDIVIYLDDYEPMKSMAAVISNILPSVRYKKVGNEESIRIFLDETAKLGSNDPVYIVNGTMLDDTKFILDLDPTLISKIEVLRTIKTLSRFDEIGKSGILVIEGDFNIPELINLKNVISIEGIGDPMKPESLFQRKSNDSRIPDLRSTLYWNSNVTIRDEFSFMFTTSDEIGRYVIQVAGMEGGTPILIQKRFQIRQ